MAKVLFHLLTNAVQPFHLHLYSFSYLFFFFLSLFFFLFFPSISLSFSYLFLFISLPLFLLLSISLSLSLSLSLSVSLSLSLSLSLCLSLCLSLMSPRALRACPCPPSKRLNSSSFRQTNFSVNFFRSQKNNNHNLCICTHHCYHPYSGHMERGKVS